MEICQNTIGIVQKWEQEQRQLSRNGKERDLNLSMELAVMVTD